MLPIPPPGSRVVLNFDDVLPEKETSIHELRKNREGQWHIVTTPPSVTHEDCTMFPPLQDAMALCGDFGNLAKEVMQ
jgi:hypothetical protein